MHGNGILATVALVPKAQFSYAADMPGTELFQHMGNLSPASQPAPGIKRWQACQGELSSTSQSMSAVTGDKNILWELATTSAHNSIESDSIFPTIRTYLSVSVRHRRWAGVFTGMDRRLLPVALATMPRYTDCKWEPAFSDNDSLVIRRLQLYSVNMELKLLPDWRKKSHR